MIKISNIFILFIFFFAISFIAKADELDDYKIKIKNENVKTFYENVVRRRYSSQDIIDSLIGMSGAAPIGTIRSFVNSNKNNREGKEYEIDACATKACVDKILRNLNHD